MATHAETRCCRCHRIIIDDFEAIMDREGRIHAWHVECPPVVEWPATTGGVIAVTLAWLTATLIAAALLAHWWPALRAALADPTT